MYARKPGQTRLRTVTTPEASSKPQQSAPFGTRSSHETKKSSDWQAEDAARSLYVWLHKRMDERVGWSQAGFTDLARRVTTETAG